MLLMAGLGSGHMLAIALRTMSDSAHFFEFEADFIESLRCIPMQVRYKLDTCGVKLKLEHWHRLSSTDRAALVSLPCSTAAEIAAYRDHLQSLVSAQTGAPAKALVIDPHPPWLECAIVPDPVQDQAQQFEVTIAPAAWQALSPLQRFALCKLSRPGHENRNFLPALQEFNLVP